MELPPFMPCGKPDQLSWNFIQRLRQFEATLNKDEACMQAYIRTVACLSLRVVRASDKELFLPYASAMAAVNTELRKEGRDNTLLGCLLLAMLCALRKLPTTFEGQIKGALRRSALMGAA